MQLRNVRVPLLSLFLLVTTIGPVCAGIAHPPAEISRQLGTGQQNGGAAPQGTTTTSNQPSKTGQVNTGGTETTTSTGGGPSTTQTTRKSNVGMFLFIAVLVLGGTGAGIFFWSRKIER